MWVIMYIRIYIYTRLYIYIYTIPVVSGICLFMFYIHLKLDKFLFDTNLSRHRGGSSTTPWHGRCDTSHKGELFVGCEWFQMFHMFES